MNNIDLNNKIDSTITIINQYADLIITGRRNLAKKYMPILSESLGVIPDIVCIYEEEFFKEFKDDQVYWVNQLQRILDVLGRDDYFAQYDVLINETVENLKLIKNMISEDME